MFFFDMKNTLQTFAWLNPLSLPLLLSFFLLSRYNYCMHREEEEEQEEEEEKEETVFTITLQKVKQREEERIQQLRVLFDGSCIISTPLWK